MFHTREQTENELNTIIDFGGTVADVFVWHKVYGKMTATLNISSRHHVAQFLEGVRTGKSSELMNITGGYHYHTVRAESEEVLDNIILTISFLLSAALINIPPSDCVKIFKRKVKNRR